MSPRLKNRSVTFFDTQFARQLAERDFPLNPFEQAVLPFLSGDVLDLGCGLGNLAVAAAMRGCHVTALDASPTAITHLARRAAEENLPITAHEADVRSIDIKGDFDCVVAIRLLMSGRRQEKGRHSDTLAFRLQPHRFVVGPDTSARHTGTLYSDLSCVLAAVASRAASP